MKPGLRFFSLLALLLVGSAGTQAQTSDPFPKVSFRRYQGNMTITAQVMQYDQVVKDAIVAVYCDESIRGKESVGSGTDPQIAYLTVYGNAGSKQELSFKVYTNGRIFTYKPSTAVTFKNNGSVGSGSEPYLIDITPVSLADNADNTETLRTLKDKTLDVVVTGRTLFKNENWNTLCLPFDATLTDDLADATLMELDTEAGTYSHITGFEDGTLYLNFKKAESITAGTPYIIKWSKSSEFENPTFTSVTITSETPASVTSDDKTVQFCGTYDPAHIYSDTHDNLFLGSGNTLYYPDNAGHTVNAFRAYFHVDLDNGSGANAIRQFVLNFGDDATAIETVNHEPLTDNRVYDLFGRRLDGVPTTHGIYIVNGRKVVVK